MRFPIIADGRGVVSERPIRFDGDSKEREISMGQLNNDFEQNHPELQKRDPSCDLRQKPISKNPKSEASEWNRFPAELYGCLCHQPE